MLTVDEVMDAMKSEDKRVCRETWRRLAAIQLLPVMAQKHGLNQGMFQLVIEQSEMFVQELEATQPGGSK